MTAEFDRLNSGDRISLNTVNGEANLIIPSDSDATIRANSLNGKITNDFGLPVSKGQFVGRDLSGRLGNGEAQLKLNSVNGNLSILRKKDGKNPKVAVNTLGETKYIGTLDLGSRVIDNAKINREIAKATADAQKQAAEAMEQAQGELAANLSSQEFLKLKNFKELAKLDKLKFSLNKNVFKGAMNWSLGVPKMSRKEKSFKVSGKPKVVIEAPECEISVRGWDKNEVRYVVTRLGSQLNDEQVNVTDSQESKSVNIKVDSDSSGPFGTTRLEVFVPKNSDLDITTDDEIRLEGVSGELNIKGGDGEINVRDSSGKLKLMSEDGQVRVLGFTGDIDSNTGDGDVYLEGDFASLTSNSVDGTITLTLPKNFSGTINSNAEVENDIGLTKESDGQWRKGNGANSYKLNVSEGKLIVRDANSIGSSN